LIQPWLDAAYLPHSLLRAFPTNFSSLTSAVSTKMISSKPIEWNCFWRNHFGW